MDIHLNQAVLHILDAGIDRPVLSDRLLELNAENSGYLLGLLTKAMASDDSRACTFLEESAFRKELDVNHDFLDISRRIAQVIFDQIALYPAIPSADLAVLDYTADGVPHLGVLKMNYKTGYIHTTDQLGNGQVNSLLLQRTCLPGASGRVDEGFFVDVANGTVRLIEKKVEMDGTKGFYLSSRVLECTQAKPEKQKLQILQAAAAKAVRECCEELPRDSQLEAQVDHLIRSQAVENRIAVQDVAERLKEEFPEAAETFTAALEQEDLPPWEEVTVSPARIKKLENRSFKAEGGIEVKIPGDVLSEGAAVEFITNPNGTISLLIKNVLL